MTVRRPPERQKADLLAALVSGPDLGRRAPSAYVCPKVRAAWGPKRASVERRATNLRSLRDMLDNSSLT